MADTTTPIASTAIFPVTPAPARAMLTALSADYTGPRTTLTVRVGDLELVCKQTWRNVREAAYAAREAGLPIVFSWDQAVPS